MVSLALEAASRNFRGEAESSAPMVRINRSAGNSWNTETQSVESLGCIQTVIATFPCISDTDFHV